MLDAPPPTTRSNEKSDDCCEIWQDKCEVCCVKIAGLCKIEDLALATLVSDQNSLVQMEDINSVKLKKETEQLLRLTRGSAYYFTVLAVTYLF